MVGGEIGVDVTPNGGRAVPDVGAGAIGGGEKADARGGFVAVGCGVRAASKDGVAGIGAVVAEDGAREIGASLNDGSPSGDDVRPSEFKRFVVFGTPAA